MAEDAPEPDALGGIDFKQDHPPTYSDFAYMAFTVGMSYAVSESEPTATHIRRVALGHALLSYAFGTGVLAVAINLATNLVTNLGQ
ncbi:DUF1345 domain-containing protein [Microbacterium sp. ARD31]|uniref:DUF1345 domain-containing protein n=1 Tax=Microbacterium sp. ARD31 TaxID=2962576 RepID=UPI00288293B5|nr:DUF1345 domain-containing protein [Microbacterium sp. ARD31]MDT0188363.1 DUF1345 domain-containing protein [Microbacterium sp. ARD31]